MKKHRRRFSLLELIIVLSVIIILAGLIWPLCSRAGKKANLPVSVDYDGLSVKYKKAGRIGQNIKMYEVEIDGKKYLLFSTYGGGLAIIPLENKEVKDK